MNVPQHVAIILDGNGRWAKKRKMPRTYGHHEETMGMHREARMWSASVKRHIRWESNI